MFKKILIVGSTHGHERIGLKVIDELRKLNIDSDFLNFEIGNPRASGKNIPFTENDLNTVIKNPLDPEEFIHNHKDVPYNWASTKKTYEQIVKELSDIKKNQLIVTKKEKDLHKKELIAKINTIGLSYYLQILFYFQY